MCCAACLRERRNSCSVGGADDVAMCVRAQAEYLKDGVDRADEAKVQSKRETAIFRRVMSRIGEKSTSARKMFLSLDSDHAGELSYNVREVSWVEID